MAIIKLEKTKIQGVFRQPDGHLVVVATVKDPTGRQLKSRRVMPDGATLAEALTELEAMRLELKAGTAPEPVRADTNQTVEAYVQRWASTKAASLKPSTRKTYETILLQKILPQLGNVRCCDLTRDDVIRWTQWAREQVQPSGKPYSGESVRSWWRPLKMILKDMSADLNLPDPTTRVAPPRIQSDPVRERGTLTHAQLHALLDAVAVQSPGHHAEIALMAYTGMRSGEIFALMWDCVDFDRGEIRVSRSVSAGVLTETTKTYEARIVPLADELAVILRQHRQRQIERRDPALRTGLLFGSKSGRTSRKTGLTSEAGGLRQASVVREPLELAARTAKIDQRVTPLVLRRTFNTLMVLAGADRITLRAIMGHSSEEMTQRYSGISTEAKQAAVVSIFGRT